MSSKITSKGNYWIDSKKKINLHGGTINIEKTELKITEAALIVQNFLPRKERERERMNKKSYRVTDAEDR